MRKIKSDKTKSLPITKEMVWKAYKKVKANGGGGGVDQVSLQSYEANLVNNLYKLWNRLSSGSYFPPPVLEVMIPKGQGKSRKLGIPTIGDRIAQEVVKSYLEPRMESLFSGNSYGYRSKRNAHQALASVRSNLRSFSWVIDMDIKNFFDEVDHERLMLALSVHVEETWVKMYVKRWLEAPISTGKETELIPRERGTPQGGVISPLLANLYLHYTLDKWLELHYGVPYVRYADDMIIHCRSEKEAQTILHGVRARLNECKLRLNEEKTKIVCCRNNGKGKKTYPKKFDFLGFRFQPRTSKTKEGRLFLRFDCAISPKAKKQIAQRWKEMKIHRWTSSTLQYIAGQLNPILRGIYQYYGKFRKWEMDIVFQVFHRRLVKWAINKYKRLKRSIKKGYQWLKNVRRDYPYLFYHWNAGVKI